MMLLAGLLLGATLSVFGADVAATNWISCDSGTQLHVNSTSGASWTAAEKYCQTLGGHLAKVLSRPTQINTNSCYDVISTNHSGGYWGGYTLAWSDPKSASYRLVSRNNQLDNVSPDSTAFTKSAQCVAVTYGEPLVKSSGEASKFRCDGISPLVLCEKTSDASVISRICKGKEYLYHTIAFSTEHAKESCERILGSGGRPINSSDSIETDCVQNLFNDPTLTTNNVSSIPIFTSLASGTSTPTADCTFWRSSDGSTVSEKCDMPHPVVCVGETQQCRSLSCDNSTSVCYAYSKTNVTCLCKDGLLNASGTCETIGKLLIDQNVTKSNATCNISIFKQNSKTEHWTREYNKKNCQVTESTRFTAVKSTGSFAVVACGTTALFSTSPFTAEVQNFIIKAYNNDSHFLNMSSGSTPGKTAVTLVKRPPYPSTSSDKVSVQYRAFSDTCYPQSTASSGQCQWEDFGSAKDLTPQTYEMVFSLKPATGPNTDFSIPIPFTVNLIGLPITSPPSPATLSTTAQTLSSSSVAATDAMPSPTPGSNTTATTPNENNEMTVGNKVFIGVGIALVILVTLLIIRMVLAYRSHRIREMKLVALGEDTSPQRRSSQDSPERKGNRYEDVELTESTPPSNETSTATGPPMASNDPSDDANHAGGDPTLAEPLGSAPNSRRANATVLASGGVTPSAVQRADNNDYMSPMDCQAEAEADFTPAPFSNEAEARAASRSIKKKSPGDQDLYSNVYNQEFMGAKAASTEKALVEE